MADTKEAKVNYAELSEAEIVSQLAEKRSELNDKLRANKAGELANPRAIRTIRRDIARLLTARNAFVSVEQPAKTEGEEE
ncbi:50S ribosomal protein L29 [Candidatus Saccharibacteria bacterium]|nr:50S ribosomal protein L29 [Candidatus Saccharibacteria bacterium]